MNWQTSRDGNHLNWCPMFGKYSTTNNQRKIREELETTNHHPKTIRNPIGSLSSINMMLYYSCLSQNHIFYKPGDGNSNQINFISSNTYFVEFAANLFTKSILLDLQLTYLPHLQLTYLPLNLQLTYLPKVFCWICWHYIMFCLFTFPIIFIIPTLKCITSYPKLNRLCNQRVTWMISL